MKDHIKNYLDNFEDETKQRFSIIHELIYESAVGNVKEKLWAKIPSYYVEDNFVRIIPFKDHINIEAKAVLSHRNELTEYKITPKGMLQIYHKQQVPSESLKVIFKESLG